MAREITITDNLSSIQLTYAQDYPSSMTATTNILKSNIVAVDILSDTDVVLIQYDERPIIHLDWNDVVSPVVVSGADLYAQLLAIWLNMPGAGVFTQTDVFTNADLVDGIATWIYTVTHPFATTNVYLVIQNPSGGIENGFPVTVVDNANVEVDFGGAIGAGNWTYTLIAII